MTPSFGKRVPLTASPRNKFLFSSCVRARFSEVLWRGVTAHRRAPPSVVPRRRASVAFLPVTPDGSGTPIITQGPAKTAARAPDDPKERAQRGARSRGAAASICRRFPRRACDSRKLQPALPVWKPPPINSGGDRVTVCLDSFALNAGLATDRANHDFYVRSCVNNRPDKPKTLDRQAISTTLCPQFSLQFSPLAVTFWPWCWGRLGVRRGEFSARGRLQWPKS
jgi:hypothetical protein